MSLEKLFQDVKGHWREFIEELWPDAYVAHLKKRSARLKHDLRGCCRLQYRQQRGLEELRFRASQLKRRVEFLSARVAREVQRGERQDAWKDALELEQVRRQIDRDRRHIAVYEQSLRNLAADMASIKRRLADLGEDV